MSDIVISGMVRGSPVEEGVPELGEGSEGQLGVDHQRVARHRGGGGVLLLSNLSISSGRKGLGSTNLSLPLARL